MAESPLPDRRPAASPPVNPLRSLSISPPLLFVVAAVVDTPYPSVPFPPRCVSPEIPPSLPVQSSDAVLSVIFQKGCLKLLPSDILFTLPPHLGRRSDPSAVLPSPPSLPLRKKYNANFTSYLHLQWRRDHHPPVLPSTGTLTPPCSPGMATECAFSSLRIPHSSFFGLCTDPRRILLQTGSISTSMTTATSEDTQKPLASSLTKQKSPQTPNPPSTPDKDSCSSGGPSSGRCSPRKTTAQARTRL